jgi:hypothetical protein
MFNQPHIEEPLLKLDGKASDGANVRLTFTPFGFQLFISRYIEFARATMLTAPHQGMHFTRAYNGPVLVSAFWVLPLSEDTFTEWSDILGDQVPFMGTDK